MMWTLEDRILQVIIAGVTSGSIYVTVGFSVAIVFNVTRVIDLSLGQYVMLGAMISCLFYSLLGSLALSIFLSLFISLGFGALIWRAILHLPSQKFPPLTVILITLGIAMLIEGIAFIVFGTEMRFLPSFGHTAPIRLPRATIASQAIWLWSVVLAMTLGLAIFFDRTLFGKALRACHEQPLAARLMGIKTQNMRFFSYLLAVAFGAIAGIVMTPLVACDYSIGLPLILKGLLAAIVGGIDRFQGIFVGGLTLGFLESIAGGFVSSDYMEIIALGSFLVLLLLRPTGLLGAKEIRRA